MIPISCQNECDYLKTAYDLFDKAVVDNNYLKGISVWIGASKNDETSIQMKNLYSCVLNKLGVNIINKDFETILSGRVKYDVLLMFTFTPCTSARAIEIVVSQHSKSSVVKDKLFVYMHEEHSDGYISRKLKNHLIAGKIFYKKETYFQQLDRDIFSKCVTHLIDIVNDMKEEMELKFKPTILIVTALSLEFKMMIALLEDERFDKSLGDNKKQYRHGIIGNKNVVVARSGMGNNLAAAIATKALEKYQSIKYIFMTGIAGGIPYLENKNEHIRLGDVVVCNEKGVVQHDMGKNVTTVSEKNPLMLFLSKLKTSNKFEYNFSPRPPNATLLRGTEDYVQITGKGNYKYWDYLDKLSQEKEFIRPEISDLNDSPWIDNSKKEQPPIPTGYNPLRPRIHFGVIASGNTVVKEANVRDRLKKDFKAKAIEMEASGISDAAWLQGKDYFIVRGICDYCNADKNNEWHDYAAAAAAAFTREIIEETLDND